MPVDLAQGDVATRFSAGDHAINALDLVDFQSEDFRRYLVDRLAGAGKGSVHLCHGVRLV